MDVVVLIGRILFSLVFLGSAFGHLTQSAGMGQYAESKGLRPGQPIAVASGVLILVGGLMVLLGVWADLGALLLVVFLVPTAGLMHGPWAAPEEERQNEMIQFQKDLALAGAALILFVFFSTADLGLMITDPAFPDLFS